MSLLPEDMHLTEDEVDFLLQHSKATITINGMSKEDLDQRFGHDNWTSKGHIRVCDVCQVELPLGPDTTHSEYKCEACGKDYDICTACHNSEPPPSKQLCPPNYGCQVAPLTPEQQAESHAAFLHDFVKLINEKIAPLWVSLEDIMNAVSKRNALE